MDKNIGEIIFGDLAGCEEIIFEEYGIVYKKRYLYLSRNNEKLDALLGGEGWKRRIKDAYGEKKDRRIMIRGERNGFIKIDIDKIRYLFS